MSVMHRREWDPDRRFVVTVNSRWADAKETWWRVEELWRFEQGSGRELLAVTIWNGRGDRRRLSQARLLGTMREVTPKVPKR